eukprot:SAG31_NODE_588_length_13820_cov_47.352452_7_plen_79_part_00
MGDFGGKRTHDSDENEAARTLAKLCTNFGAGFAAGAVTTLVLNPYDQALYLSVVHNRSFLRCVLHSLIGGDPPVTPHA